MYLWDLRSNIESAAGGSRRRDHLASGLLIVRGRERAPIATGFRKGLKQNHQGATELPPRASPSTRSSQVSHPGPAPHDLPSLRSQFRASSSSSSPSAFRSDSLLGGTSLTAARVQAAVRLLASCLRSRPQNPRLWSTSAPRRGCWWPTISATCSSRYASCSSRKAARWRPRPLRGERSKSSRLGTSTSS